MALLISFNFKRTFCECNCLTDRCCFSRKCSCYVSISNFSERNFYIWWYSKAWRKLVIIVIIITYYSLFSTALSPPPESFWQDVNNCAVTVTATRNRKGLKNFFVIKDLLVLQTFRAHFSFALNFFIGKFIVLLKWQIINSHVL